MKLNEQELIEAVKKLKPWLCNMTYITVTPSNKINLANYFTYHCGQRMIRCEILYNDKCSTHKETALAPIYICACPNCAEIKELYYD